MNPTISYLPVLIIILSVPLSNCSNNSKRDNTFPQNDSLFVAPDNHFTTLANGLNYFDTDTEDLYISIVSSNQLLFPLARFHSDSILMNPWTEMWNYEDQITLDKSIPKEWYFYSHTNDSGSAKLSVKGARIAEFACLMNWVVSFSDVSSSDSENIFFGTDVGFAFNHPIKQLSDSEMTANKHQFAKVKTTLRLIDNDVDGDSRIIYTDKMYFHWQQSVIGIIEVRRYESLSLLIIHINSNGVNKSLDVGLGGC
jgi:hypothetical protein